MEDIADETWSEVVGELTGEVGNAGCCVGDIVERDAADRDFGVDTASGTEFSVTTRNELVSSEVTGLVISGEGCKGSSAVTGRGCEVGCEIGCSVATRSELVLHEVARLVVTGRRCEIECSNTRWNERVMTRVTFREKRD